MLSICSVSLEEVSSKNQNFKAQAYTVKSRVFHIQVQQRKNVSAPCLLSSVYASKNRVLEIIPYCLKIQPDAWINWLFVKSSRK